MKLTNFYFITVVLEANDVTSLLEQFEASEAATTKPSTAPKKLEGKPSTKYHQDIRNSLPKEVIDRIKVIIVEKSFGLNWYLFPQTA